jgi:hypothetical protein
MTAIFHPVSTSAKKFGFPQLGVAHMSTPLTDEQIDDLVFSGDPRAFAAQQIASDMPTISHDA